MECQSIYKIVCNSKTLEIVDTTDQQAPSTQFTNRANYTIKINYPESTQISLQNNSDQKSLSQNDAYDTLFDKVFFKTTIFLNFIFISLKIFIHLFIWLCPVLVAVRAIFTYVAACKLLFVAYGIQFPDQGLFPGPLHWKCGVLATGPPGKYQITFFSHD